VIGRKPASRAARLAVLLGLLAMTGVAAAAPAMADPLPDGRVYELVSPADKNGGDVLIESQRTRAATDGDAVAFASLSAFAGAVGTGIATDYLAQRVGDGTGTYGWTVKAITPPQGALSLTLITSGFDPLDAAFTDDLDTSLFWSQASLTPDPFVSGRPNFYLRQGLRSSDAPADTLVTACPLCASSGTPLPPFSPTHGTTVPVVAAVSADGRSVLFESTLKLTSDATDGSTTGQVNVYLARDGTVQDLGVLPDGTTVPDAHAGQGADAGEQYPTDMSTALSRDGTKAVFSAAPTPCTTTGVGHCGDLYLRDTGASPETTTKINASEQSPRSTAQPATFWFMNADGTRVFFTTAEPLTNDDTNTGPDLYLFDATEPAGSRLTRISRGTSSGGSADYVLGASGDGHTIYFTSTQPLNAGDPSWPSGTDGIYIWSDAAPGAPVLRFVAPVSNSDPFDNQLLGNTYTLGQRQQARVSPDGRFLLFAEPDGTGVLSDHGGTDYDQGGCNGTGTGFVGCRELYLYDAASDTVRCASCRPDGLPATVDASDFSNDFTGAAQPAPYENRPLTGDGKVFFTTAEALVPGDTNNAPDAYEWENGQVYLLSDGTDPGGSYFLDASPDGRDVFIATRARLTPWDTDGSFDLYDVRAPAAGHPAGISGPPAPPGAGCSGTGCRGAGSPAPGALSPSTAVLMGPGNVTPRRGRPVVRCKAGKVRKRTAHGVRCVKRPKPRKRRVHHGARGAG
jgi:hypothetical protein